MAVSSTTKLFLGEKLSYLKESIGIEIFYLPRNLKVFFGLIHFICFCRRWIYSFSDLPHVRDIQQKQQRLFTMIALEE